MRMNPSDSIHVQRIQTVITTNTNASRAVQDNASPTGDRVDPLKKRRRPEEEPGITNGYQRKEKINTVECGNRVKKACVVGSFLDSWWFGACP